MMKLLFLFTALILSATAYAEEANDTTFNVKDKKIVVDVQDSKTIVKVYDNNGFQLLKTREMEYVNGQEVEQVYVGSPLIPTENLQNLKFRSYLPTIWYGYNYMGNKIGSTKKQIVRNRNNAVVVCPAIRQEQYIRTGWRRSANMGTHVFRQELCSRHAGRQARLYQT